MIEFLNFNRFIALRYFPNILKSLLFKIANLDKTISISIIYIAITIIIVSLIFLITIFINIQYIWNHWEK